jgi:hypothetical protein
VCDCKGDRFLLTFPKDRLYILIILVYDPVMIYLLTSHYQYIQGYIQRACKTAFQIRYAYTLYSSDTYWV